MAAAECFLLWNAVGGISWATTIGLVAYYAGQSATGTFALTVAGLTSALGASGVLLARQRRRRRHQAPSRLPARQGRRRAPTTPDRSSRPGLISPLARLRRRT
jgi:hypothetical protein